MRPHLMAWKCFFKAAILFFLLSGPCHISAQDTPGGIGDATGSNGQPRLVLWLLPDSLGLSDGSDVLTWKDYSGNGYDLTAESATSPVFIENSLNGHDFLQFSKDNNRIIRSPFDIPSRAVSVFMVLKTSDSNDGILSYALPGTTWGNDYFFYKSNDFTSFIDGQNRDLNVSFNDGSWKIFSHQWRNSGGNLMLHINGDEEANETGFQTGLELEGDGCLAIGNDQDGFNSGYDPGDDFDGDIAEFIMFGSPLKQAQRTVIENYLAQKYGLDANLTTDLYVPQDASYDVHLTGMGKESDGITEASADGMVVTRNGGFDNGEYIMMAHDGAANSVNTSPPTLYTEVEATWQRDWFVDITGNVNAKLAFDLSEGINGDFPANIENYRLMYRSTLSADYDTVVTSGRGVQNGDQIYFAVDETQLADGYYTLGTVDQANSPLEGVAGRTWYTLISGDWDNPEVWTLDPSGALPNNPNNYTPSSSPTSNADQVVILSGKTVTVSNGSKTNSSITIEGRLDLQATSGHSFGEIRGGGKILLRDDHFPSGNATHFVTEGQGEGTVEYYGTGFNLNQSLSFYDLEINLSGASETLTLLGDYTINGGLSIEQGGFQVNDNSSGTGLNITVHEDLMIRSGGSLLTGEGDARHQLNLYGDFTNHGTAELTNRNAPNYSSEASDGITDANFLSDSRDQKILCDGPTTFYRIEIDKGTDDTYILSLEATDPSYFNLYGYANEGHSDVAQLTDNANALGLVRGTVRIGENIEIPTLSTATNYNVSESARLWVEGGFVAKNDGNSLVPYGKIRVTAGTLEARVSSGITTRENGLIKVMGGTLNTNQIRTSILGADNVGGYVQSGGTTNILGGNTNTDYYCFNLTYPGNVFHMTGGTLHIHEAHGRGGIFIASDDANQKVTGGTVIMDIGDGNDFEVTSKAPFWNVIIRNSSGGTNQHLLTNGTDVGATNVDLDAQPLEALNDLTLESGSWLETEGNDVYIGRNFTIQDDALYEFHQNTTHFNGTQSGVLYVGDITGLSNPSYSDPEGADPYAAWEQPFYGISIDKPDDATLTLATGCTYDAGSTSEVENGGCKNIHDWRSNLVKVTGPFALESGRVDIDRFSIRLYEDIMNKGIFGVDASPLNALIKTRKESTPSTRVITTDEGSQFGNLRLNVGEGILEFTSDVHVKRMEYKHGRIDIGSHNLKIDTLVFGLNGGEVVGNNFSVQDMIIMDGNASDGGLSLYVPQVNNPGLADPQAGNPSFNPTVFFFPIGTGTTGAYPGSRYTPANIRLESVSDDGYVTVNVVSEQLQTAGPHPLGDDVLERYFRIRTEGFSTPPKVERYRLRVTEADIPDGTNDDEMVDDGSQIWNPAYVLDNDPYTRTHEINDGANSSSGFQDNGTEDIRIFFWGNEGGGNPSGGFDLIEANHTAGLSSKFSGSPEVYYNKENGPWNGRPWNDPNSWFMDEASTVAATDFPGAGDIVVMRGDYYTDGITVNGNRQVAKIIFKRKGDYQGIEYMSRLRLEPTDQLNVQTITGVGDIYLRYTMSSSADLNADIGEFAANDTSLIQFYMRQNGTYVVNESDFFTEVPTLRIYGQNSDYNRQVRFNYDLNCKNLIVDGESRLLVGGNYTVENRTRLGYTGHGGIEFPGGTSAYIFSTGEFVSGRGKSQGGREYELTVAPNGGNGVEHVFEARDSIKLDFTDDGGTFNLDFYTSSTDNNVILRLAGNGDGAFINGYDPANSTIELYKIQMDKGTDQSSRFVFTDPFTLNGPTAGVNVEKALTMKNGHLVLDDPNINFDLTTGDDDFYLPGTSALEVRQGQVRVSGNSGILLDGKLQVSGGTVDMSGGDNYIHYSASGNAEINVSAGSLTVGSQIRRGLTSTEGILRYYQSGGTVIVGNDQAPENNRGVLEVLNDGSHFSHTGGDLYIARAQDNPSIASLYLDPQTSHFEEGSYIHFGHTNTPADEIMSIYSTTPLPHLVVNNDAGNHPNLRLRTMPLTVTDSLEIDAGATFDAKGLDLTLLGDLIVQGTFTAGGNSTWMSGNNEQQITGSPVFWNLLKDRSNTLRLNNDITVANELHLSAGTLADDGSTLRVRGHVWMDAGHQWGGSGDGIRMEGNEQQYLRADGMFGKLTLNNSEGVHVPTGYTIEIDDHLQMEQGILDIGKNLLVLDADASIIAANAFSVNNMIQTNISFTDAGIKKFFPGIASTTEFTYPLGSGGKYTPVELTITGKDAGGYIRVKAADERHPTIINDVEPCQQIEDTANVLEYHWLMEASGITGFSGEARMHYYPEDIKLAASYYDTTDYITARLLLQSTEWNKYGPDGFDEDNQMLKFSFTNTDDLGISGDYTAGVEDQDPTSCEGAIPDEVPAYVTTADGNWSEQSIWQTYPDATGSVPAGGPKGAVTLIEHQVTVSDNYLISYKTTIDTGGVDNNGVLMMNQTFGHRLGIVEGSGTLQVKRGDIPAGIYDEFFGPDGGTLEYAGTDSYDVLSEITSLNSLRFSGTGSRRLPNLDLKLYGNLEIFGGAMINEFDRTLRIDSNMVFTGGSLDAGTGPDARLILEGPLGQEVTGDFSGANSWHHVDINNTNDIVVHDNLGLTGELTLNAGKILVDPGGKVIVDNPSLSAIQGATPQRYIDGILSKRMYSGDDYSFPVGSDDRYGELDLTGVSASGFWDVRYYNRNPDLDGYDITSYASPIKEVSDNEYWSVQGPGSADVTIRWDDQSELPARTDDRVNDLYIVEYLSNQWNAAGNQVSDGGVNAGTVTTDSPADLTSQDHIFTLASAEPDPVATATFVTGDTTVCEGQAIELTVDLTSSLADPQWTLEVDENGAVNTYNTDTSPFTFTVTTASDATHEGTYTILSVSDQNGTGNVFGAEVYVTVGLQPLAFDVSGGGDICSDSAATLGLSGSENGVDYELYRGSTLVQTISGDGGALIFGDYSTNGTYSVEAVSIDGCRTPMNNTVTVNVFALPDPEPYADQNPVCYQSGLSVPLHANDGNGGYIYTWDPADDLTDVSVADPLYQPTTNPTAAADTTWYVIEADNNGCVGVDSLQMILYRMPQTGNMYHVPNDFDLE